MRAILTYHSIDESRSPISVGPDVFRAHCAFLAAGKVQVVSLETLWEDPPAGDAVAITFDDGFANFATEAMPVLRDHALPATLFVVSDHVGGHNDWEGRRARGVPHLSLLSWNELSDLAGRGVRIGAHTRRHRRLPSITGIELMDEVQGCLARIESALGLRPTSFAYPYGAVDEQAAVAVRESCALACTTELRALGTHEDRALLPRLDMFYFRDRGQLEAWGTAGFRSRLWLRGQGRRLRRLASGATRMKSSAA